jgi:16S rRNA (uracil1498-N3)-methyltransferase
MGGIDDAQSLKKTLRRFFISPRRIKGAQGNCLVELDRNLAHHLRTVLRIGAGAKIVLFDGTGVEYLGEIISSTPSHVRVRLLEQSWPETESSLEITLAQALLKEQAFDRVLTSATELGVDRIVPVLSRRTVVKIHSAEAEKKLFRWRKILEEASAQSGRVKPPEISHAVEFEKLLIQEFDGEKILLWEKAKGGELEELRKNQDQFIAKGKIMLLLGPEGGFEDEEAKKAMNAGFLPLGLGPRILRAETAPLVAIALVQYFFGDLKKAIARTRFF